MDDEEADELKRGLVAEDLSAEDLLSNIELQVNLLLSFVNDLIDLARIEEGYFTLDKTEFSFHKLMNETYLMFNRHAEMQGKKLIYDVHNSMPELIYGDKTRLQQVLINLIKNALKFTRQNGFVKVNASYSKREESILVKIQDTGIGISAQD